MLFLPALRLVSSLVVREARVKGRETGILILHQKQELGQWGDGSGGAAVQNPWGSGRYLKGKPS